MSEIKVPYDMLQAVYRDEIPCSVRRQEMKVYLKSTLRWLMEDESIPLRVRIELKEIFLEHDREVKDGTVEYLNGTTRPVAIWWDGKRWGVSTLCGDPKVEDFDIFSKYAKFDMLDIPVAVIDASIPDLLFDSPTHVKIDLANRAIREAYRRGKKAGEK